MILLGILLAYLIGSIPTGYIFVKVIKNTDIREHGSGNVGDRVIAHYYGRSIFDHRRASAFQAFGGSDPREKGARQMNWPQVKTLVVAGLILVVFSGAVKVVANRYLRLPEAAK